MTERTRVWRWADLLLVVGIVLLLVPIVVADEDSQDVPTRFTTAETRIGDRAAYALFIGSHNESLVQTTPFLTLDVRYATPDEVAFGAEYTVEGTFTRMTAQTAWLNASSWDLSVRHLFTADGTWLATRHVGSLPVVHGFQRDPHDTYGVDVFTGHRAERLNFDAEFALRAKVYRPTGVGDDLAGAVRLLIDDEWQRRAPYWNHGRRPPVRHEPRGEHGPHGRAHRQDSWLRSPGSFLPALRTQAAYRSPWAFSGAPDSRGKVRLDPGRLVHPAHVASGRKQLVPAG